MSFSMGLPVPPGEPPPIKEAPLTVKERGDDVRRGRRPGLTVTLAVLAGIAMVLLLLLIGLYALGVRPAG